MSVPIGSIIAFAGEIVDPLILSKQAAFEFNTGWMICDGRTISTSNPDFKDLFDVIEFAWGGSAFDKLFHIPDLRGFFLRGVSTGNEPGLRDPDLNQRYELYGAGSPWGVGSYQRFATHRPLDPKMPFKTDDGTGHNHFLNVEINAGRESATKDENTLAAPWASTSPQFFTDGPGHHTHTITGGGDNETRPINASVYWLIRYK